MSVVVPGILSKFRSTSAKRRQKFYQDISDYFGNYRYFISAKITTEIDDVADFTNLKIENPRIIAGLTTDLEAQNPVMYPGDKVYVIDTGGVVTNGTNLVSDYLTLSITSIQEVYTILSSQIYSEPGVIKRYNLEFKAWRNLDYAEVMRQWPTDQVYANVEIGKIADGEEIRVKCINKYPCTILYGYYDTDTYKHQVRFYRRGYPISSQQVPDVGSDGGDYTGYVLENTMNATMEFSLINNSGTIEITKL